MGEMTKFGADLIQAMSEALAHAQGKDVACIQVHGAVGIVDAKAVRKKLDLTQDELANVLGTSPSGYKETGAGKRAAEWRCAHLASHHGPRVCDRAASPAV